MRIRPVAVADALELGRIRAQVEARLGFKLDLPDLVVGTNGMARINPRFASALVLLDDEEKPRMATLLKKTTEAYLLMDRSDRIGHQEWLDRFLCLEKAAHLDAVNQGIFDTFTFLSPKFASTWSRVLEDKCSWSKEEFAVWRKIHGK